MRKIYVECSCLGIHQTGISKTVTFLLKVLKESGYEVIELMPTTKQKRNLWTRFYYYNILIPGYCRNNLSDEDIFLIPNNMGKFFCLPHQNTWVLVHDIIPLTRVGYTGIRRWIYKFKMNRIRRAKRIVTISEYVKKQLIDTFNLSGVNIKVLYWFTEKRENYSILSGNRYRNYFLSIGSGEPRKNVEFLINNWRSVYQGKYSLILFGREWKPGRHQYLQNLIALNRLEDFIHILGSVSETELIELYKGALGFIFPSLEEGFGLPPLEALTQRTNIILPKVPVNYEIYGNVAFFYSLSDVEELKICMESCQHKIDEKVIESVCNKFSTNKFKEKVQEIFNQ